MVAPRKVVGDTFTTSFDGVLSLRNNFIAGLNGLTNSLNQLQNGIDGLKRAYASQFNVLLPENHPERINSDWQPPTQDELTSLGFLHHADLAAEAAPAPIAITDNVAAGASTAESGANTKRKRKPHDPAAPKRALTTYFLFMQVNKPRIKTEHPEYTAQEVSVASEAAWAAITDSERGDYEFMYQVDLARYYKQMEYYNRGEPVPDIDAEEARRLYNEHLASGVPFRGRKGKKESRPVSSLNGFSAPAPNARMEGSSDEEAEGEPDLDAAVNTLPPPLIREEAPEEVQTPAPKAKRQKTAAATSNTAGPSSEKKKGKPGRKPKVVEASPALIEPLAEVTPKSSQKKAPAKPGRKRKSDA